MHHTVCYALDREVCNTAKDSPTISGSVDALRHFTFLSLSLAHHKIILAMHNLW